SKDLAVTSPFAVSLYLGFGTGDFAMKQDFGSGGAFIFPADLNGDGRVDLAVPEFNMRRVAIHLNQGTFPVVSNRAPVASAGGPYEGAVGVAVAFNGTGSSDPDGDPLSMTWSFGDGASATGPEAAHAYQSEGTYAVTITVSDGEAMDQDATTASIGGNLEARAFTLPEDTFRLFAGKPIACVRLEPVESTFDLSLVDLETVRLRSEGTGSVTEIGAITDKPAPHLDRDRNGVPELKMCYAMEDVRLLFASVTGTQDVPVSVEGSLTDGRAFRAETVLRVIGARGFPAAFAAPNPMNPTATLFVATSRPGYLRASLFDTAGRRVRMLSNITLAPAGVHELRFDGRTDQGTDLPSGIYFYLVESAEGTTRGRVSILK
ncbi:MAG TPA: PKD domain-containing protein, partial [Candidatus Eisenbacteria bacterium]|nr:PKD domain-containing protein [Candidatus Eisenbacteria bacterium]